MVEPPYAVRVVQTELNFSKSLPVESNVAVHNLLKIEIDIAFVHVPVSILHLTST